MPYVSSKDEVQKLASPLDSIIEARFNQKLTYHNRCTFIALLLGFKNKQEMFGFLNQPTCQMEPFISRLIDGSQLSTVNSIKEFFNISNSLISCKKSLNDFFADTLKFIDWETNVFNYKKYIDDFFLIVN